MVKALPRWRMAPAMCPLFPQVMPAGQPHLATMGCLHELCQKLEQMVKRYNETEKRNLVSSYLESGQSYAAYSRVSGVSVMTLKFWRLQYGENTPAGFVAIFRSPQSRKNHIKRL